MSGAVALQGRLGPTTSAAVAATEKRRTSLEGVRTFLVTPRPVGLWARGFRYRLLAELGGGWGRRGGGGGGEGGQPRSSMTPWRDQIPYLGKRRRRGVGVKAFGGNVGFDVQRAAVAGAGVAGIEVRGRRWYAVIQAS